MLASDVITIKTGIDFFVSKNEYLKKYDSVMLIGMIDQFFDYYLGELKYRTLRFGTEQLNYGNYQDNVVVKYTDAETPYT